MDSVASFRFLKSQCIAAMIGRACARGALDCIQKLSISLSRPRILIVLFVLVGQRPCPSSGNVEITDFVCLSTCLYQLS